MASSPSYEVFLNFRGEDTRYTFVSFLDRALEERGINVFNDSRCLQTGESIGPTLLAAIQGSKVSIPVFSKGYADSKWCLNELTEIVKCHRSNGQLVLPIFFNIYPSDVRNQTGSFECAFLEHQERFARHTVEGWRKALREVGNLRGEIVDDTTDPAELIDLVVKKVLRELNSNTYLDVCKYPIGMDSHINDMLFLLNLESSDVQFVGIWGFGGIGKTTIAKAVYNCIFPQFSKHSFISDVRDQATQNMGLVSLQRRLLNDTLILDNIDIPNHHAGKQLIEERLRKQKVLIVIDDIDSKEQVDALVGKTTWFGQGSRVIITTRDEEILSKAGVNKDKIYRPRELNHDQSLQLFSLHAFRSELPPDDYMQLSNDVASYSGGLPLTLEVLGSLLSDTTTTEEWESALQYLKEIPHEDVQQRLKISFEKLDDYQKEIFLDAACFFIGWKEDVLTSIWEVCGYYPRFAIPILIKRSLIKFEVDHFNRVCLKMHDQIRDMGRGIVLKENRMEPSKRSRLWSHDDIVQVLNRNKGTDMIKRMVLPRGLSDVYLHQQHFDMMSNLEFLDITSESVNAKFWSLPSRLRWFRWTKCPWDIVPNNLYHESLVHLKLLGPRIGQAWYTGPQHGNERFQKLKVLDLSHCNNLSQSPDFSWFPYLEQLDLSYCGKLEILDESIGLLSQLKRLNLERCRHITELPNSIGSLKSLVNLNLSFTPLKGLPDNISKLSSLKYIELTGCSSLKKLPEFIGDLKNLIELNINVRDDDKGIAELPDSVGLLEKLEILNVEGWCRLGKLPRSMGRMRCLHTLNLIGANISELPDDFSTLSNLEVLKMSWNLKSFPVDLSCFKKLRILELIQCELLEELPEVSSSLVELKCVHCYSLIRTFDISRLKVLKLRHCEKLEEIQVLEDTECLEHIEVINCHKMIDTSRNTHGQGTLLLPEMSQKMDFRLCGDGWVYAKGLILCIVFRFEDDRRFRQGRRVTLYFEVCATIHQKGKTTMCKHTLRFEDVASTTTRDTICLHHFKGLDWFGIPLQGKDSIMIRNMILDDSRPPQVHLKVKFWELMFQGREADVQKPFFSWQDRPTQEEEDDDDDDDEEWNTITMDFLKCLEFDSVPEVVGVKEAEMSRQRNRAHLDANNDEASLFSLDLNDEPSLISLDLTLTPYDARSDYGVNVSDCQFQDKDEALLSAVGRIVLQNQDVDEVSMAMERLLVLD